MTDRRAQARWKRASRAGERPERIPAPLEEGWTRNRVSARGRRLRRGRRSRDGTHGHAGAAVQRPDDAALVREAIGYDVAPDGQRFLMAVPEERRGSLPYVVITNWLSELRERVPK